VKDQILQTLKDLRAYALTKKTDISLYYHEEISHLIRFANSAISLDTDEHLIRLEVTATIEKQQASFGLITSLDKIDEMKQGIDKAVEMAKMAQPLTYQPTLPVFKQTFSDETGYDQALAEISNADRLKYFNQVAAGLETDELNLGGIFSNGANIIAQISTSSEHTQYIKTSDAQITAVLANSRLKWEVVAEQSAWKTADLDAAALNHKLAVMVDLYQKGTPEQLPLGKYDIIFGAAATASLLEYMGYIGYNGGQMKRGGSFLAEKDIQKKVLSDQFTLADDPTELETFPLKRDAMGMERQPFPLFKKGVFQGFMWNQDDADEFGAKPTGHTTAHDSIVVSGGSKKVNTLDEVLAMPRDKDILYIPYIHYIGLVNPTEGILTGSSRFGTLLLKKDGTVTIPYNVRLTQSLLTVFGDQVEWLSEKTEAYNASSSYGSRNPTAIVVPAFIRVNDLEISHSNSSY
jgi:predicted Zn-dependent protease